MTKLVGRIQGDFAKSTQASVGVDWQMMNSRVEYRLRVPRGVSLMYGIVFWGREREGVTESDSSKIVVVVVERLSRGHCDALQNGLGWNKT